MKAAKTLAILFAFVLAVFCLNAPMVWGADEHPWDEEGGDQDTNSGGGTPTGGGNTHTGVVTSSGGTSSINNPLIVQVALWYYDVIGVHGMTVKVADNVTQTETSQPCKK